MPLIQVFAVHDSMNISSKIIGHDCFQRELSKSSYCEPINFSFHPFALAVLLAPSLDPEASIKKFFSINIKFLVSDEEQKVNIFSSLSSTKSILLMSEAISLIEEVCTILGLELSSLYIHESYMYLNMNLKGLKKHGDFIYKMALLRAGIESVFFARGMSFRDCSISALGEEALSEIEKILPLFKNT